MNKIIYLIEQPLDERNFDRFGIQTWINRGWDVEVWDFTPLAHSRIWLNFIESGRILKTFVGYFPIASKSQLEYRYSALAKIQYYVDFMGNDYHSMRVKLRLSRMGCIRVIYAVGSIPEPFDDLKGGFGSKLIKAIAKGPGAFVARLINKASQLLVAHFIKPGLIIISGKKSLSAAIKSGYDQDILQAHNLDYDFYLRNTELTGISQGEYAVFIDQDLCFHSDFIYENIPFCVSPEKYFPAICKGLRTISAALGVNLKVAAHPRSSYQQRGLDYFEGIPIQYNDTAELIGRCRVVVCHSSAAIQLAVMFGKPIIFVTTDELVSSFLEKYIEKFASALGKPVINLDGDLKNVDWQKELSIDFRKYAEYRNEYIKIDGSPEIQSWDIVAGHIEKSVERASAENMRVYPVQQRGTTSRLS